MKNILKKRSCIFLLGLLCILSVLAVPEGKAYAGEVSIVSAGKIDYEGLTMQIFSNNNSIVYYSLDQESWYTVEGLYDSYLKAYTMDISWISLTKDVTLYLKGNTVGTVEEVTLPMQNKNFKIDYDKAEGLFEFTDTEDADSFQWRKASDYHWTTVELEEDSASYQKFMNSMENFKTMGAKLIFRLPQTAGYGSDNEGCRPSREVTVAIPKRSGAPSVKVNPSKLNLNTTEAMEYYEKKSGLWVDCEKSMLLEDIAPEVLYSNGSKSVTLMIRTAQTSLNTYSKTAYVTIPGQAAAPAIGDSSKDVTYYYQNSKLMLQFGKASNTNLFEYTIVKPDYEFDAAKANWTTDVISVIAR
jgi:hypothetical protein